MNAFLQAARPPCRPGFLATSIKASAAASSESESSGGPWTSSEGAEGVAWPTFKRATREEEEEEEEEGEGPPHEIETDRDLPHHLVCALATGLCIRWLESSDVQSTMCSRRIACHEISGCERKYLRRHKNLVSHCRYTMRLAWNH